MTHTPRQPWHQGHAVGVTLYDGDGPGDMVGVMVGPRAAAIERAAYVVRAVNSHATLLAACEALVTHVMEDNAESEVCAKCVRVVELGVAAIERARGETP